MYRYSCGRAGHVNEEYGILLLLKLIEISHYLRYLCCISDKLAWPGGSPEEEMNSCIDRKEIPVSGMILG